MLFKDLVFRDISNPLKMENTRLIYSKSEYENFAKGYDGKGRLMPENNSGAAGGICSTTTDMLKYIKYQLNEDDPIVKLSHNPTWGDIKYYAMGLNWQMDYKANKHLRIFQSGGTAGFNSYIIIYPELKAGIIILSNESDENSQGGLSNIAMEIFNKVIDRP